MKHLKEIEDSGVSSRKSDISANAHHELSSIEKEENMSHNHIKDDYSCMCLDLSKRFVRIN